MIKEITGCMNCPMSYAFDFCAGYGCKLLPSSANNFIEESEETYMPITPVWCPLKTEEITLQFKKK